MLVICQISLLNNNKENTIEKVVSFRDILKASKLSQYNEIELLSIDLDDLVADVLESIGFDCAYAVQYYAANHRDMSGKVAVGYIACGEININRKHMNAVYTDNITRIAASSYLDRSLTVELAQLSGTVLDFKAFNEDSLEEKPEEGFFDSWIEDDWKVVEREIAVLEELREHIRGSTYNEAGSPKTRSEYKEWQAQQEEKA